MILKNNLVHQMKIMKKKALFQLVNELKRHNLDELLPCIGVEHADYISGGWCIYKENGYWLVYHSERYIKSNLSIFTSVYDAVNFYIWSRLARPENDNSSIGMIYYQP